MFSTVCWGKCRQNKFSGIHDSLKLKYFKKPNYLINKAFLDSKAPMIELILQRVSCQPCFRQFN